MKTIKRILTIIAALAVTMSITSCEDFLNKTPEGKIPEEKVDYSNLADMYKPVSGAYAKVRGSMMHWAIWNLTVQRDGDVFFGTSDGSDFYNLCEFKYPTSFWAIDEYWKQCYNLIKACNGSLEALEDYAEFCTTEEDQALNRAYQGEVKFIRAWAYYRLSQGFGPAVILRDNKQIDLQRSTRKAVYKYIHSELDYCIANMPRIRPNESEHFGAVTAYSAMALKAKCHLNFGEYEEVEKLTDEIINSKKFELYPDFYELFKKKARVCNESLFECQCTDFNEGTGTIIKADVWFGSQGPVNPNSKIAGWGHNAYRKSFVDWADARGETVRRETAILEAGTTTRDGDVIKPLTNPAKSPYFNGKAYTPLNQLTPGRTGYGDGNNIRIMRYADVLLMNAEAKVKLGKNGDAPFNEVRKRAAMPELTNVTFEQILDERRMELSCEWGERFNDLCRTGLAKDVLPGFTPDKEFYPVPFAQLTQTEDLKKEPKDE